MTAALVGSDSLLAREIRDIVATSGAPLDLRLIAAEGEQAGVLTRVGDEPSIVGGLNAAGLSGADAVILAGSAASSAKALELLSDPPESPVIDLTFAAEDLPGARLRAPVVEDSTPDGDGIHVIAHPAAIAIALFLRRLHGIAAVRRCVIQILAPASEQGAGGIEELQQQTVSLLSFKSMPRAIFDSQLGFNMLARYGQEAPVALEHSELRIERHLASLLAAGEGSLPAAEDRSASAGAEDAPPMPSLRLIQAPVFHGYGFSAWVEFEEAPEVEDLEQSLAAGSIEVRGGDFDPPHMVGQAGQDGISVGAIAPDRNHFGAMWFWFVTDNLRLAADNAIAVARQLL
jgi:aspartate-semialdehyde dehydrogenase